MAENELTSGEIDLHVTRLFVVGGPWKDPGPQHVV